jgi:hypothetical protein
MNTPRSQCDGFRGNECRVFAGYGMGARSAACSPLHRASRGPPPPLSRGRMRRRVNLLFFLSSADWSPYPPPPLAGEGDRPKGGGGGERQSDHESAEGNHRQRPPASPQSVGARGATWSRLRKRAPGMAAFRRQHPIGPYVLDFFLREGAARDRDRRHQSRHGRSASTRHSKGRLARSARLDRLADRRRRTPGQA